MFDKVSIGIRWIVGRCLLNVRWMADRFSMEGVRQIFDEASIGARWTVGRRVLDVCWMFVRF